MTIHHQRRAFVWCCRACGWVWLSSYSEALSDEPFHCTRCGHDQSGSE